MMIIDKIKAMDEFKNIIELPILRKALYYRILEIKDAISANIEQYKNILKLRNILKNGTNDWPKTSNDLEFELVNIKNELWVPVIPKRKDCEPSKIIPGKLVDYIVKKSEEMPPGLIEWKKNLIIPGIKGRVFEIWFEKIQKDYIHGFIKGLDISTDRYNYSIDIDRELKDFKNVDFEELFGIFRLIFESSDFRKSIVREYRKIWADLVEEGNRQN